MARNFPEKNSQDFEKLVRGMQMGFFNIVICEKSVRDSSSVMNTFSLPYKCSFHLVYFTFSAFAQFFYSKTFELFPWIALVKKLSHPNLLSFLFFFSGEKGNKQESKYLQRSKALLPIIGKLDSSTNGQFTDQKTMQKMGRD